MRQRNEHWRRCVLKLSLDVHVNDIYRMSIAVIICFLITEAFQFWNIAYLRVFLYFRLRRLITFLIISIKHFWRMNVKREWVTRTSKKKEESCHFSSSNRLRVFKISCIIPTFEQIPTLLFSEIFFLVWYARRRCFLSVRYCSGKSKADRSEQLIFDIQAEYLKWHGTKLSSGDFSRHRAVPQAGHGLNRFIIFFLLSSQ